MSTIEETISSEDARCFYERVGIAHDLGEQFERAAKARGLERLDLQPGLRVLNVAVGTGKEQRLIQQRLLPGGVAVGIDLAPTMLHLSRERVPPPGDRLLCEGDARALPFRARVFDRVFSSYMLDLIPTREIALILREIRRVLRPEGRFVGVSLTEGTTIASRALMGGWKAFYRLSPHSLGGCRPVRLTYPLLKAGFADVEREVVVQLGMPSEVVVAFRKDDG